MLVRRYTLENPRYIIDISTENKIHESGFIPSIFSTALYPKLLIGMNLRTCNDIKKINNTDAKNKKSERYEFKCYHGSSRDSNVYLLQYSCHMLEPVDRQTLFVRMPVIISVDMAYLFDSQLSTSRNSSRSNNDFGAFTFLINTNVTMGNYVLSHTLIMSNHMEKTYGSFFCLKRDTWENEKKITGCARLNSLLIDSDKKALNELCDKGDNISSLIKTFDKYVENLLLILMNKSLRHWFRVVNKRIIIPQ